MGDREVRDLVRTIVEEQITDFKNIIHFYIDFVEQLKRNA